MPTSNELRSALDALAAGTSSLGQVQAMLREMLVADPAAAQPAGVAIEASYRAGSITGQVYLDLMDVVRSGGAPRPEPVDRTRLRRKPRADANEQDGRTRLRPASTDEGGETRFRPVTAPPPAAPPPPANAGTDFPAGTTDRSGPLRSGPTGSSWSDPSQWEHTRALQPGDVVKERFVLEEIIGQGGMGVVFRARDMRKEEAQDRNPFVALKVLNEDFKHHPESLKALQREARKAQNLAHPNIVTVFDFDRDGSNVYIVMELLEGQPLDDYIRSLEGRGLKLEQALPIIRALCGALSYAHQHKVVHSDFKPANAYITRGSVIKVFDFGIARAAKLKGPGLGDTGNVASELTLFDAGTLGALTPAYASCEMIEGQDPDPRDDVYALGCVAYELLTGMHPFQRKSAVQARDAKLRPRPVRGLTGRQWRALRRALSFERATRSASVDAFLQEISPQKRSPAVWVGAAAVLLAAIAAALVLPGYLQERRAQALAVRITSGAAEQVEDALPDLLQLPETVRARLLLDENVRTALVGHFRAAVEAAFDARARRYDYPLAAQRVAELRRLLPDSQAVAQLGTELEEEKNDEIARLSDELDAAVKQGWLVAEQNASNARGVLAIVAQIDPQHRMLADPRLPTAYAEQAQLALQRQDIGLAQALAGAGLAIAPQDATLQDLNDRAGREAAARARAARLAELRQGLANELPAATSLAQIDAVHEDLLLLQADAPRDAGLLRVQARLQQLLGADIASLAQAGSLDAAQAQLARYADLAQPQFVTAQRTTLTAAFASGGVATTARDSAVAGLRGTLDGLLVNPAREDAWDGRVRTQLAQLSAYLPPTDEYMSGAVQRVATTYLQQADTLREQGRLSEAERALELASTYSPQLPQIRVGRERLAALRAEQQARDQEQKRIAEIGARKQKFADQVSANDVVAAAESLRVLRGSLPADDAFLQSAPRSLAEAHVRLAEAAMRENRFDDADEALASALELDRDHARIAPARAELTRQLATRGGSAAPQSAQPAATPPASDAPQVARVVAPATPQQPASQPGATTGSSTTAATTRTGACSSSLAGYGKVGRGICYDMVAGARGPDLVVIPAGGGIAAPFAMSRTEISGASFTAYCRQTGRCAAERPADLPVTGITVAEAEQYAQWLTSGTGFTYRLPTEAEWLHAASAPNDRVYNCVFDAGGRQVRGFALVGAREMQPNDWGLYHMVGNAREWVKTPQGWNVRGGAFSDANAACLAGVVQASNGAADPATGLRLVRELR